MDRKRVVIYTRVSTKDQDCARQVTDLREYASRAGFNVVGEYTEKASGAKNDRKERAKVLKLAQARKIDAVLVTEMSRWGRSTTDLISTLEALQAVDVSLIAESGMTFDLTTAQGKLIAGFMSLLSEFERNMIRERVLSGLAQAKREGKTLGRPKGKDTSRDAIVMKHVADGRSYSWIKKEVQISKTTIVEIVKRNKESA